MSPRWERTPSPPHLEPRALLMDATLRPHRSLSFAAFKLLLAVFICMNVAVAGFFLAQGAFPVAGFLGLDVLALSLAFWWNYRAARRQEFVRVAPGQVHVASVDPAGGATHWVLNPAWARVARDERRGVLIRAGRGQMRVGAFLSEEECASFAQALDAALWRAKRGGYSPSTSAIE
ncbi:MAG: DUF2244 domain-containing protein [Hyphomonadaceae bacterium]|nr:DUF2244 domain-containing protein [Hyphomonadaceae bacterium]